MADALQKLLVLIEGKDEASPAMKTAGESARGLGGELTKIGQIAAGVATGQLGAQIGLSLSEHFKDALTEVQNFGNQVFQLQSRLGLSAQSASGLLSVFERMGVSSEESARMLDFFSRGLRGQLDLTEDAGLNGRSFAGTMAELGVRATDASGNFRPLLDVLSEVQDRISKLQGDGQTAARAMALFSRAGGDLAPVLNLSSGEFQKLQSEAQRLGVTLSQDNVNQIRTLYMAHKDLDEAVRGVSIQFGLLATPYLTNAAKAMAAFATSLNGDAKNQLKGVGDAAAWTFARLKELNDYIASENRKAIAENQQNGKFPSGESADEYRNRQLKPIRDFLQGAGDLKEALGRALGQGFLTFEPTTGDPVYDFSKLKEAQQQIADERAKAEQQSAAPSVGGPNGRLSIIAMDEINAAKAEKDAALSREAQLNQLNTAHLAGQRALEVVQFEINREHRERLELVKAQADAELAMIPIKQEQQDLEVQLLQTQDRRAQIERETAVNRARLAGLPATAAAEDIQYQEQLLQAKINAGILGHRDVMEDVRDLFKLQLSPEAAQAKVDALVAGHNVTLAERAQQAGQLRTDIATAPIRETQAELEIQSAIAQRGADQVAAEQRRELLQKTDELIALEERRRQVEDKLFDVTQRQTQLASNVYNVTLNTTIDAGGESGIDYSKLSNDLTTTMLEALKRAAIRTEAPAPVTAPGAAY